MDEGQSAVIIAPVVVAILFIGLPWLVLHYVTKWKQGKSLTVEDENLLDDLHDTARRLEDRLITIERIMNADNPSWRTAVGTNSGQTMGDIK